MLKEQQDASNVCAFDVTRLYPLESCVLGIAVEERYLCEQWSLW
jgi:hypothetical protein